MQKTADKRQRHNTPSREFISARDAVYIIAGPTDTLHEVTKYEVTKKACGPHLRAPNVRVAGGAPQDA
jgi:hypothetical protein